MAEENKALMKTLEWVIDIDPPAIIASVAEERTSLVSPIGN